MRRVLQLSILEQTTIEVMVNVENEQRMAMRQAPELKVRGAREVSDMFRESSRTIQ